MGGRQSTESSDESSVHVARTRSSATIVSHSPSHPLPARPVVLPTSRRSGFRRHQSLPSRNSSHGHATLSFPLFYDVDLPFPSYSSDSGLADSLETSSGLDLLMTASSLPTYYTDIKCPICSKKVAHDQIEQHMFVCLSKPRVVYNDENAVSNLGECIICFFDMEEGSSIARLPCFCVYHKGCIDEWFSVKRCCPKHPEGIFS